MRDLIRAYDVRDFRLPRSCEECRAGTVYEWDGSRCEPVCWTISDGGKAIMLWKIWSLVRKQNPETGQWGIEPAMVPVVFPSAVMSDDEERLEWLAAMQLCASVLNFPLDLLDPDDPDDD